MSIYTRPATPFEAVASGFPAGLVGTIAVRIEDGQGNVVSARSTSGIVESPAGSGIYTAVRTAPSTAGAYLVVWDDGTTFAADTVTVTTDYFTPTAPAAAPALCAIADVRGWLQKPAEDTAQDGLIADVISRASAAIMEFTGREIASTAAPGVVRTFDVGGRWLSREIPIGDLSTTPTAVKVMAEDGSVVSDLVVASDVQTIPLVRPQAWMPITALRFRSSAGALQPSDQVEITGTWGWPSVPAHVTQAAVMTAGTWVRRHVQMFSSTYQGEGEDPQSQTVESIPAAARALLRPFRMPVIA